LDIGPPSSGHRIFIDSNGISILSTRSLRKPQEALGALGCPVFSRHFEQLKYRHQKIVERNPGEGHEHNKHGLMAFFTCKEGQGDSLQTCHKMEV
jgi:hypothetical protein